jgi:hypothetical protein
MQDILIKKANVIDIQATRLKSEVNPADPRVMSFQAEVMRLGFIMGQDLTDMLSRLSDKRLGEVYAEIIPILAKMVGDDVEWEPFYPNFPSQVMEVSSIELFVNAILHYFTEGTWRPDFVKEARLPAFENVEFKTLHLAEDHDLIHIFGEMLSSNGALTPADLKFMDRILDVAREEDINEHMPDSIPFKENLCWFVAECIQRGWNSVGMQVLKTATDILRVATHLSGGDVSLATNTKFKSFGRPLRRAFMERLEQVVNTDDIFRHRGKWVRLAHSLHAGDYRSTAPEAVATLNEARNRSAKYRTFDSKVESAIAGGDKSTAVELLTTRPGVFARRLDHMIRTFGARGVVTPFLNVADQIDTRVLLQLYGHFNTRTEEVDRRVVWPKSGKSTLLKTKLDALSEWSVKKIRSGIEDILRERFSKLDSLGNVYVDESLLECPVPLNLRNASEALNTVARGTRIPFADKEALRLFIYWKGRDIDLSANMYTDGFAQQSHVSYTQLRNGFACHSGDITHAPNGACEFIDIDIKKALEAGYRYIAMSVLVYSGPNFDDHEICYAGWMTRNGVQSNEIFDPKTVEQKIDLTASSKKAIPVIFDLQERQAIWLDMATGRGADNLVRPNNVENNSATLYDAVESALNLENKANLYDLFWLHGESRGTLVETAEKADTVFSWDGDVTPSSISTILSEYV